MLRRITIEVITLLVVLLFVYAAVSKWVEYDKFKIQIGKSPLLTAFSSLVVIGIPAFELLLSIMLVIKVTRVWALYGSLFLMSLFTSYLVAILNFSYYIPCSCGGILQQLPWKAHIVFNIFFILLIITGIMLQPKPLNAKN